MTNKKPNFIIEFDNSNPTKEEREYLLGEFIKCLLKLEIKQNLTNKKHRGKTEQKLLDFGLDVMKKGLNSD